MDEREKEIEKVYRYRTSGEYLPTAGLRIKRKVSAMGTSFGIALPKWWVQMYGLEKKGEVKLKVVRESQITFRNEKKAVIDESDNILIIVSPLSPN